MAQRRILHYDYLCFAVEGSGEGDNAAWFIHNAFVDVVSDDKPVQCSNSEHGTSNGCARMSAKVGLTHGVNQPANPLLVEQVAAGTVVEVTGPSCCFFSLPSFFPSYLLLTHA